MGEGDDRFGVGWRTALAPAVLAALDRIDVIEVIAEDWMERDPRPLRTLARQRPVVVHGVGLGLASESGVDARRLDRLARLVGAVEPEGWSEHLAFVRGGGTEIGHLAAPPRDTRTVGGALANLERAKRAVGTLPLMENVATLIDPPGSDLDEASWIDAILRGSDARLLLDLHNLHANATNFAFDPIAFLDRIPCDRIATVHLAGGRPIATPGGRRRILDDHLHPTPDAVFALLTEVGARVSRPVDVILERDGRFPPFAEMLAELDRARAALAAGRAARRAA